MRARDFIDEYKIDNVKGLGSTSNNQEIRYRGFTALMKPSVFLSLAAPLDEPRSVPYIIKHIEQGGGIGSPYLTVDIPEQWYKGDFTNLSYARVTGHEGRNRMMAIQKLEGDNPVEMQIHLRDRKGREISDEMMFQLQMAMKNEDGKLIFGRGLEGLFEPIG